MYIKNKKASSVQYRRSFFI